MAQGFQTTVYPQPAPGVEGDFCDHNPRATVNAGPGALVAGAAGVVVGRFCWFDPNAANVDVNGSPSIVNSSSAPDIQVAGFVHREQQGLITNYLGGTSMLVPGGFPVTVFKAGGFFVKNTGASANTVGMKAMANVADGTVQFAAAGSPPAGAVETKWIAMSVGAPGQIVKISSWPNA
jgi:hypothetical protein